MIYEEDESSWIPYFLFLKVLLCCSAALLLCFLNGSPCFVGILFF
jgi:hypothetical protein